MIRAKSEGMVIFPSAAEWKETPDIEEGAVVREQQTLLMIPDLTKMQVKVGVHESKVGRLRLGMRAKVELQDSSLFGEVDEIAEVTRPAGWWTGNMVKYDTIIRLEPQTGSEARHECRGRHRACRPPRRSQDSSGSHRAVGQVATCVGSRRAKASRNDVIEVGDTNDEFTIVTAGLSERDEVVSTHRRISRKRKSKR